MYCLNIKFFHKLSILGGGFPITGEGFNLLARELTTELLKAVDTPMSSMYKKRQTMKFFLFQGYV